MTFPNAIQTDRGEPAVIRVGTVTGGQILLQGTVLQDVGFIDPFTALVDGDTVVVAGQSSVGTRGSSWLVLGRVVSSMPGPLAADTTNVMLDQNTVSAVFVDFVGASGSFTKTRDTTSLLFWLNLSFFTTNPGTSAEFAIEFTDSGGGVTVVNLTEFFQNLADVHMSVGGSGVLSGIPAGVVTYQLQWRRTAGAGTLFTDVNDRIIMTVLESEAQ